MTQYILWSPESAFPPKKVFDLPVMAVLDMARSMVSRYGGKFYVAELVALAEPGDEGEINFGVLEDSTLGKLAGPSEVED